MKAGNFGYGGNEREERFIQQTHMVISDTPTDIEDGNIDPVKDGNV